MRAKAIIEGQVIESAAFISQCFEKKAKNIGALLRLNAPTKRKKDSNL